MAQPYGGWHAISPFVRLSVCLSHAPSSKRCSLGLWLPRNTNRNAHAGKSNPLLIVAVRSSEVARTATKRLPAKLRSLGLATDAPTIIIPAKAFARDYVFTGVRLSVCLSVITITK